MRRLLPVVLCLPLLLFAAGTPVAAQSLADRIERAAADRDVTIQLPARAGLCGCGDAVIRFHDADARPGRGYSVMWMRERWDELAGMSAAELRQQCVVGPVQVTLERSGTRITGVRPRIAPAAPAGTLDLGAATVVEAADYLIGDVARHAGRRLAGVVMALFSVVDGESWQPLLALARDQAVSRRIREQAIFWLGQQAGQRATEGLAGILEDDSEELQIRKQAIFALSQQRTSEATDILLELAETSREPELRKQAFFWLSQQADDDPRVLALFEKILTGR